MEGNGRFDPIHGTELKRAEFYGKNTSTIDFLTAMEELSKNQRNWLLTQDQRDMIYRVINLYYGRT